jgi:hypothetical protein
MRRLFAGLVFPLLLAFPITPAAAALTPRIPASTQAALLQAEAASRAPWIYGVAIVLAGIAIGAGIYLASRSSRGPR